MTPRIPFYFTDAPLGLGDGPRLDELIRDFRERPLDAGPYTFLAADALTMPNLERSARAAG